MCSELLFEKRASPRVCARNRKNENGKKIVRVVYKHFSNRRAHAYCERTRGVERQTVLCNLFRPLRVLFNDKRAHKVSRGMDEIIVDRCHRHRFVINYSPRPTNNIHRHCGVFTLKTLIKQYSIIYLRYCTYTRAAYTCLHTAAMNRKSRRALPHHRDSNR